MNFKRLYIGAMAILVASPMFAQNDDFGIWTSLGAEKKLAKNWNVEADFGFRSADNSQQASRWSGALGVNYKALSWLKLGAGYVYIYDFNPLSSKVNYNNKGEVNGYNVDHGFWQSKHRGYFDATASLKVGRFKFSLRERYQYTYAMATDCARTRYRDESPNGTFPWEGVFFKSRTEGTDHKPGKDKHYLRTRMKVSYNIPKCPFNPFASYELTNDFSDAMDLEKTRLMVGSDWKITKQHVVSLGYLYQHGADGRHEGGNHALDVSYKFSF